MAASAQRDRISDEGDPRTRGRQTEVRSGHVSFRPEDVAMKRKTDVADRSSIAGSPLAAMPRVAEQAEDADADAEQGEGGGFGDRSQSVLQSFTVGYERDRLRC